MVSNLNRLPHPGKPSLQTFPGDSQSRISACRKIVLVKLHDIFTMHCKDRGFFFTKTIHGKI